MLSVELALLPPTPARRTQRSFPPTASRSSLRSSRKRLSGAGVRNPFRLGLRRVEGGLRSVRVPAVTWTEVRAVFNFILT